MRHPLMSARFAASWRSSVEGNPEFLLEGIWCQIGEANPEEGGVRGVVITLVRMIEYALASSSPYVWSTFATRSRWRPYRLCVAAERGKELEGVVMSKWFDPLWLLVSLLALETLSYVHMYAGGACPSEMLAVGWSTWFHHDAILPKLHVMRDVVLQNRFWRCYAAYVSLAVIAPTFVTICMDIETPDYAQFTFALGRGVLLYTFSGFAGLSFALDPVCMEVLTVVNVILAVHCYMRNRMK